MSGLLSALSLVVVEVNININILLGAIARSLDLVQQLLMDSACGRSRPACNLLGILRNLNDNINIIGLAVLVGLQGVQSSCYNLLALVQLVLPNLLAGRLIVCRAVLISSLGVFVVQSLDQSVLLSGLRERSTGQHGDSHNSSQSNRHEFLEHFHSGIPPIKNDFYFGKPLQLLRGLSR